MPKCVIEIPSHATSLDQNRPMDGISQLVKMTLIVKTLELLFRLSLVSIDRIGNSAINIACFFDAFQFTITISPSHLYHEICTSR